MKGVLELLYNESQRHIGMDNHAPDSVYARTFNIKRENLRMLNESLSEEQKVLLDAYTSANAKTDGILYFENFCHAFYLGVQLATELAQKEVLPK